MDDYEVVACPACHGRGEAPNHEPCKGCEGFGGIEICRADGPGQRESHDARTCGHYQRVGQPL
jgi:RecJ-like exonuclease